MVEISLGRYWRGINPLGRLDGRVKLFALLAYLVSIFYFSSVITLLFSFAFLFSLILASRINIRYITKGLLRPFLLFVFFALIVFFFSENGHRRSFFMLSRLVLSVISSSLLTLTTKPKDIAGGIEKTFGKGILARPVHIAAAIIMIAFRFLPILCDEAERLGDAQKSRGCSFEDKTIIGKCRAALPLLIPLFVSAFHRADELALAFDERLYCDRKSTRLYPMKYTGKDYLSYMIVFLYLAFCFVLERNFYV